MFRRCISLLVIAGLFASQLAAVPHAHGGLSDAEQQRHDATPHFHANWLGHGDHGHSHGGHRHEPAEQANGQPLSTEIGGPDHDASAIFVPIQSAAPVTASQQESAAAAWQLAALVPASDGLSDIGPSLGSTPPWHPPDEVLDGSDTYLTLRNLRI